MTISQDGSGGFPRQPQLTRRDACSLAIGLSTAALLGAAPAPGLAATPSSIRYVVTDRRHAESLAFGHTLSRQGAQRLEVTEGLTRLWHDALLPLWQGEGSSIAGMTPHGVWACIAEQARSWGRRSILVGHHTVAGDGVGATHLVRAPQAVLNAASALDRCGGAWPQMMASLAMQCPAAGDRQASDTSYRTPHSTQAATALPPTLSLVSWIIA